jgi:small subunit ribosomal protein S1
MASNSTVSTMESFKYRAFEELARQEMRSGEVITAEVVLLITITLLLMLVFKSEKRY